MVYAHGGFANGMPKNLLVVPSVAPWKVPLSRTTVGDAAMQPKCAIKTPSTRSERRTMSVLNTSLSTQANGEVVA